MATECHQFDTGMFVRTGAWHGLGNVVEQPPKSIAEAIELAGLGWKVQERKLLDAQTGLEIPDYKALVRSDNDLILNVCKKNYTPVQNEDAFKWFEPMIADRDVSLSAAVSLNEGRKIAITCAIENFGGDVVNGDRVESYLLLYNSHDGSSALGVRFTNVRVVCRNTLAANIPRDSRLKYDGDMAWSNKAIKFRHTKNIGANLESVQMAIDVQRRTFQNTLDEYRAMTKVQLDTNKLSEYLTKVMVSPQERAEGKTIADLRCYDRMIANFESGVGMDIPGVGGTLWAGLQAVTEWTTHQRGNDGEDLDSVRARLNSSFFGDSARVNERAHLVAMSMV